MDIGCWNGDFLKMLPDDWEKWGLDLDRHPDLPQEIHFLDHNVEEPFPPDLANFDLVFAGEIIEHVLATQAFLEQCHRVLKPGGFFILTTPNLGCWLSLWRWICLGQPFCVNSDTGQDGHVRYLSLRTLKDALARAGFQVLEMASVGGLEFLNKVPLLHGLVFACFPLRGKNLMAVSRKSG